MHKFAKQKKLYVLPLLPCHPSVIMAIATKRRQFHTIRIHVLYAAFVYSKSLLADREIYFNDCSDYRQTQCVQISATPSPSPTSVVASSRPFFDYTLCMISASAESLISSDVIFDINSMCSLKLMILLKWRMLPNNLSFILEGEAEHV